MQRDYIMRLIEQIAALMASIIAKERAGKYPEAKVEIDEKARQTIGLSLEQMRKLSPEAVSQLLASSGGLRYGRAVILAELLLHDAKVSEATGQSSDALLSNLHAFACCQTRSPPSAQKIGRCIAGSWTSLPPD